MTDQEINEAVARKMGKSACSLLHNHPGHYPMPECIGYHQVPRYSERIEAAWEIVEHLSKNGIGTYLFGGISKAWHCDLHTHPAGHDDPKVSESADTSPMAICLAFLKLCEAAPTPAKEP